MEALIQQMLDLAAEAPPELNGTAGMLRLSGTALRYGKETRAGLASQLRHYAAEDARRAELLVSLPITAALFELSASLKRRGADLLDPLPAATAVVT